MKRYFFILILSLTTIFLTADIFAQNTDNQKNYPSPPRIEPKTTSLKIADKLANNLEKLPPDFEISREKREQAYAKLLEGQRYIWSIRYLRSAVTIQAGEKLAKDALLEAVEFDPRLAESYTALAELALSTQQQDIDEAITFSRIATKIDNDNFGGHRFLARLYTIKSGLNRGELNPGFADKAIYEWNEITRLDPRYAEAWAFLSEFYREQSKTGQQIDTLRNWLSSATPIETGFYTSVLGTDGELTPENASKKLGQLYLENGQNNEALSILTIMVADSPDDPVAIDLLTQALENADKQSLAPAIEALRQAVFSNPANLSLTQLLAQTIANSGNTDDAVKFLKDSVSKYATDDKNIAAGFQVTLGDVYRESDQIDMALTAYKDSLVLKGIGKNELTVNEDRDFASMVVVKIIETYKGADRFSDAKLFIDNSRILFGKDDLSLDKEYINLLLNKGKKDEALKAVRAARLNTPLDYNLIRTEASVLADLGKVNEGVALIRGLIEKKPEGIAPSIMYDDYVNYLYISSLYNQSKRPKEAIQSASRALDLATGKERKQIAQLSIASAQQTSGDFGSAEKVLRGILVETPDNPIALNNLGYLFLESGKNYEEALTLINKAVKIDPRNPSYLDSLGWAYFKLGKFTEAENYLEKAVQYDASSSAIFEHLGDVYLKNGKSNEAKQAYKKALGFSSNSEDSNRINSKLNK